MTCASRREAVSGRSVPLLLPLVLGLVLAGCADEPPREVPTSAECIEQGLILNASAEGGPRCEEPLFEVRGFEDPQHHCVVTKQRDRVHAPDLVGNPWVQGQYWDYELAIDGQTVSTTRLVYYDDQDFAGGIPQHYMVGTVTRDEALRHALLSENPMIGRVHRILYSPHESGDHADMFHFPLCDGSTWTTTFYGERFTMRSRPATIDLPRGQDEGFLIEGSAPSGSTLRLSYSPRAQWFTFIDLDRADGGSVDMQLTDMGTGHTGPAYFLRGQQDLHVPLGEEVLVLNETGILREEGGEGPYDSIGLWVDVRSSGEGIYRVELVDPAGTVQWSTELGTVAGASSTQAMTEIPFEQGTWTLRQVQVPPEGGITVEGQLRLVSIYDRSGEVG